MDLLPPCSHSAERMVNERVRELNDVYVSGCFTSQLLKNLGSKIPCISYCTDTDCLVSNTNRYLPTVHILCAAVTTGNGSRSDFRQDYWLIIWDYIMQNQSCFNFMAIKLSICFLSNVVENTIPLP